MTISKFLGLAFMCHQRADRSFFIKGKQFPLCARCTGMLIGYIAGITIAVITKCEYRMYFLLFLTPMIVDGGIQHFFGIDSNNIRRLITGVLSGIGIVYIFISIHFATVSLDTYILKYYSII